MNNQPASILKHLPVTLLILTPIIFVGLQWSSIPDTVPTHFNASMVADAYGSKTSVWGFIAVMTGTALLVHLLMLNIHKIDPKLVNQKRPSVFGKIGVGIVLFLIAIEMKIVLKMMHPDINTFDRMELPVLGLLFVFLGNYMINLKPNYFVGIRLPWTLSSDYNWRKTHKLGGKLWLAGGLVITIVTMLAPPVSGFTVLFICVGIMVGIPVGYSYNLFRKEHKNTGYYDKETTNNL